MKKQYLIYMMISVLVGITSACSQLRPSIKHSHLGHVMKTRKVDALSGYVKIPQLNRLTLIDFWATYCKPCKAHLPALKKLYRTYHKKGLVIIGVTENKNPVKVDHYIKEYKVPWPIVIDGQHKTFLSRYNIDILPRYFLVDPAGKIIQIRGGEKKAIRMLEKSIKLYLEM